MAVSAEDIRLRVLINGEVHDMPVDKFRNKLKDMDKDAGMLAGSFGGLGPVIAGAFTVTAAVKFVSVMKDMTDQAAKLEKGVKEIGTLMGGLSPEQVTVMSKELGNLSVSSGQAIDKLTKARYDIVSAGFSDSAKSMQVLNASAKLAVGGVTDVSIAADLLTTAMNSYRLEASSVNEVSDDLFTIVRNGKTTMTELGSSMGALIATAGPLNVSLDEVGAALSTLTANGQSTAMASTAVSNAILELSKPSKDLTKALDSIGIKSEDLIKSGGGLAGALDLVRKASEETGIPMAKLISREEALRAILPLTSTSANKFSEDLASMKNNAGEASKAFDQMSSSTSIIKDQAAAAFDEAKRKTGEALISSDLYKESLMSIRGLFEGISGTSHITANNVIDDASQMETSFRKLGTAIKDAFSFTGKVWDLAGQGVKRVKNWEDQQPWSKLNLPFNIWGLNQAAWSTLNNGMDRQLAFFKSESGSPGMSVADETMLQRALLQKTKLEEEASKPPKPPKTTGKTIKGDGTEDEELSAKQKELERQLEEAIKWYGKETESIKGLYDLNVESAKEYAKLTLLRNQQINSAGDTILSEEEYRKSLDRLTEKYHEGIISGMKSGADTSAFNLGIYSYNKKENDTFNKKLDEQINALTSVGRTLDQSGIKIAGWDNFVQSYESLSKYFSTESNLQGEAKTNALITGVSKLFSGIGQVVGGETGQVISNTANMAASGAAIGSAFGIGGLAGGIIGAGVGLLSSLFGGGSSAEDQQKQQNAQSASNQYASSINSMAASGNTLAQQIMRIAGYDVTKLAGDYTGTGAPTSAFYGIGIDSYLEKNIQNLTLFYTLENNYNKGLLDYVDNLGKVNDAIKLLTATSTIKTLDQIKWKYEEIIAILGDTADVQKARVSEEFAAVTGITADSMGQMIMLAMSVSTSGAQAGRVFAETFEAQFIKAMKEMAISNAISQAITPLLTPVMSSLVSGMISGTLTSADMASMLSQVKSITSQISPIVSMLYSTFNEAGLNGSYTTAADSLNPAAIEPRASGGPVYSGRTYKVNETRTELFTPSVNGLISPNVSSGIDFFAFLQELKTMLSRSHETTVTIDGEEFRAWMENARLKTETRIANGLNRTTKQVF